MIVRPMLFALAAAVAVGALPQAQQPTPRAPAAPAGQVRDPGGRRGMAPPAKTGTGAISGTVSTPTGQPSWGARVMLSGAEVAGPRSATTDNLGRFSFSGLAAGRYSINVNKPGHVNVSYGQRRYGTAGTPIVLRDGEQREIAMVLPRGGVITGIIVDERGEPAINVNVRGMRYMTMNGQRRLQQSSGANTDDRGVYRLHSLQPGDYVVCVSARNMMPPSDAQRMQMELDSLRRTLEGPNPPPANVRQTMTARLSQLQALVSEQTEPATGYAPVCNPGGATPGAAPIVVAAGEERTGIDLQLSLTPVARIEGVLVVPQGISPERIQVMMGNADETMGDMERQGTRVEPNGQFRFQNVAPGRYLITARTMQMGPPPGPPGATGRGNTTAAEPKLWGMAEVVVNGQDLDVGLELQRGATLSGQIAFQPTTLQPPSDGTRAQVSVFPYFPTTGLTLESNVQGTVDAAGRFTIPDVFPGRYRMSASVPGGGVQGWIVDSIMAGAQDALDFPLEVKPGQNVGGIVVTMSDRPTELSGTVVDEKGQPATDHTLLLYSVDPKYWTPQSRRIRTQRAGSDGTYTFRAVPPGEYRLTTLMDPEPGSWYDREVLEQLDTSSVRITLLEGEKRVEHVRVRGGQ